MERISSSRFAEELLQQMEGDMNTLSDEQIWFIHDTLLKAAARLRSAHNARQPFLNLPVEVLSKIFTYIPDPCVVRRPFLTSFWRSAVVDSSTLLPVTQTCQRLRQIALHHHVLWGNIDISKRTLIPSLLQRSLHAPLVVAGSSFQDIPSALNVIFPVEAYRIRELRLCEVTLHDMKYIWDFLKSPLPLLESFSLDCHLVASDWEDGPNNLPLSPDRSPRLRHLFLKGTPFILATGFPHLTHIAFSCLSMPNVHDRLARFLSQCPLLESVALDALYSMTVPDAAAYISPVSLEHLKRVTLHELDGEALQFYLSLLQPCGVDTAYHILGYSPREHAYSKGFLIAHFHANTVRLCVSIHPDRDGGFCGYNHSLAVTLSTNESTRRVASYGGRLRNSGTPPSLWITQVLSPTIATLDVREVWIVNASSVYPWLRQSTTTQSGSPLLTLLPVLETVILVVDHTFHLHEKPSLHLLPSSRDSMFNTPNLTTIRISHGYSDYAAACTRAVERGTSLPEKLDITQMVDELASGAYGYLKHLVLETTTHLTVDEEDVERLQEYFATVRVERLERLPSMPVCGEDPTRWGCEKWPGSLW